jgi:hypothetical protein
VQAEIEWRDIMVPIREKLARSTRPFDFEGVAGSRQRATTSRPRDANTDGDFVSTCQHVQIEELARSDI